MDVICLFCGDKMQWESDFEYDEICLDSDLRDEFIISL